MNCSTTYSHNQDKLVCYRQDSPPAAQPSFFLQKASVVKPSSVKISGSVIGPGTNCFCQRLVGRGCQYVRRIQANSLIDTATGCAQNPDVGKTRRLNAETVAVGVCDSHSSDRAGVHPTSHIGQVYTGWLASMSMNKLTFPFFTVPISPLMLLCTQTSYALQLVLHQGACKPLSAV